MLICMLATTQAGWAQTAMYANGYEDGIGTWNGQLATSESNVARTGSKSCKGDYTGSTSEKNATQGTGVTPSESDYCHIIGWARAEAGSATTARIGFNSNKKGGETTLSSSEWTRITFTGTGVKSSTIILYKKGATTGAYFDDVVAYYNDNSTIDLTAPSAPTIGTASTSGISWTNGSDTGTGATGIQQTLIFKRSSGSSDNLKLNNQGIYSLTATEGPSVDQDGNWTLIATVAGNATLYSGTLSEGRYAIVHRDLAYNYSAAAYTTVSGGGSTPVDLTDQQFAWSAASYTATIGGSNTFPTLTKPENVDVTYSATTTEGGNAASDVASIDNSGVITLNKAGTAYINAIFAGNSSYNAKTVTYTLTVNAAASDPTPTATFNNGSYTIGGTALDLSTLWNSTSTGTVTYTVTNDGGTGASIDGSSFTATTAGTATVKATQAAVSGSYSSIEKTATITVNASGSDDFEMPVLTTAGKYIKGFKVQITNKEEGVSYKYKMTNASSSSTPSDPGTPDTAFPTDGVSLSDSKNYKIKVSATKGSTTKTTEAYLYNVVSASNATLTISHTTGTYNGTQYVTLSKDVLNGNIRFATKNGTSSSPSVNSSSTIYTEPIEVATSMAIGAKIYDDSNGNSGSQKTVTLTINDTSKPSITTQPKGTSYTQGASPTALTVVASGGTGTLSYQWYKNTDGDTSGREGDKILGATSATLATNNISTAEVGTTYYYCIVKDAAATPESVTSNKAEINVIAAAAITAPALKIQSGDAYLEKIDDTHYTITDKSQQIKVRLYVEKNTCVRYTFGENMPADPTETESTATVKDNSSNGSRVESSNITFEGKDSYYVKAKAWNADGSQSSEIITYEFRTAGEKPSAPTITDDGTTTYTTNKSVTIATTANDGATYYKVGTTAETSASAIAAGTAITGTSQTITAEPTSAESNIVVSAVTVKDGNYSDIVTATYTYAGKRSFLVKAADKTLQVGGRDNVDPYITYLDGTRFEIGDDDDQKLSDYFTFTYERTAGADADVLVDSYGVINIPGTATPGNTAKIKITATPTPLGQTRFNSGSQDGTMTVTVKAKEEGLKMSFYWDPECTEANQVQTTEWDEGEGKRSVFKGTFENGRMIYVKPAPGYEIWVATVSSKTKNDSGLTTPTASIGKYDDTHYSTTHGIPLYISDMSNGQEGTLVIGLKAYKAGTTEGVGSAVSARFSIKQPADGQGNRPAAPTFEPTKSEGLKLSTAQTVAAVGAPGSYVFSKFGSKNLGLGYFINYLEGTQAGRGEVATFSTEVGPRDIKALQITGSGKEYYISKYGSVDDYQYNLASKLLVTPASYYVKINDPFTAPVLTKITTDQAEEPSASNYSSPTLTGYFYNKQKAEANAAPYQGLTFEKPAGTSLLSYELHNFNGANARIDETTGAVTIGDQSGYAIVTVKYAGGEEYTIDTKKVDKTNTTTSPMTATYRINIVNPNEYLPTITPSSRKFANNIDVTISAPDENHFVKYVVAEGKAEKTNADIAASGETINKSSRITINVGADIDEDEEVTVYAVASDDAGNLSPVVKETYTKVTPLQKPTLSPDGVTKPYEYTESELAVAAVAYNAGAVIYYTTDGSDPTKDGAKMYDGASKILVEKADGTTIVKAAAYLNGIYSDVVTGTYVPTDNLAKPWFLVNNTKVEGTEMHISTTDVITIDNDRTSSTYYYTLDGTAPTTTEGQAYTEGFKLVKTVTASAIATENGLISPATTVTFIIDDEGTDKHSFWEAIDETTPNGKMAADDRKVYVTKHTDTKGTSSYIYVENLAATFGGFDNNAWNKASIGEKTQGAAMDGVGKYSIRNTMDVKEETDKDYDPTNMLIKSVHGRTHALPSQGAYVKFEPEKDGELTIWALQQGGLHYNSDGDFCSRFIRFRPVFMVDETGKSITASKAESTACLSKNWGEVEYNNWLPKDAGYQNGDKNLYYDNDQNTAIYNMYTELMSNNSISDGGRIKPLEAPASIYQTLFPTDDASAYNDVHGYVMPSGGNVKYTFPVEAGKTYFFFGFRTKLGIRGFNFVPTTTDLETVTLPQDATDATTFKTTFITPNKDNAKNVTLARKMTANTWTTFCLPFSVSQTQLENTFGAGTQVMQFVNVEGYTMNVFKHYHHMIVAGTPIMVRPVNTLESVTFNGVHVVDVTPEEICDDGGTKDYKFVGSYTPMTVNKGSYYIGNKDGAWHQLTANSANLNGSRAYLQLVSGGNARALTMNIGSIFDEEDDTTTGISIIGGDGSDLNGSNGTTTEFDGNIYNLQGQLVRKNVQNLNGLTKGVYIINGKKVVIK